MEQIDLKVNIRTTTGNSPARQLRRAAQVPGVLYGPDTEPILLTVAASDLEKIRKKAHSSQSLLKLTIQNGETTSKMAIIKELQTQPLSGQFIHVDFYEVAMDRKIRVHVPVVMTGKCAGVEKGGMLQLVRRELEVLCFPNEIPETIEIDISALEIGDAIHVEDIPLQGNLELSAEVNFTVVTVLSPKKEEAAEAEEEDLEEDETAAAAEADTDAGEE